MGEKIKDLHSIQIGSSEFMIELNEGYADEGRVIHIQNSHFRYLFKERDFLELAANVLRAKSELDYIREKSINWIDGLETEIEVGEESPDKELIREFSLFLEKEAIDYRLVEIKSKYVSLIVNNSDYNKLKKVIQKKKDIEQLEHPYGQLFGYTFLYQMRPFELILYKGVYIELFFQLPCMSLTPKTWIPLEQKIQNRVWVEGHVSEYGKMLDNIALFIFRICWAVFKDRHFTGETSHFLSDLLKNVNVNQLKKYLEEVFFSYTDTLLEFVLTNNYEEIIGSYFTYKEY